MFKTLDDFYEAIMRCWREKNEYKVGLLHLKDILDHMHKNGLDVREAMDVLEQL